MTHFVYRCYDADRVLLYVGSTANLGRRMHEHLHRAEWWRWVADVQTSGPYPIADALDLELRLIRRMGPVFNIEGNDDARPDDYRAQHDPEGTANLRERMAAAINRLSLPVLAGESA